MAFGLHLRVLGSVSLERDGQPASPIAGKKLQALIAYLAVESRHHTRDELAALLWGDMAEERARHNLRQALSKLRKDFADSILVEDDRVWLDTTACSTDLAEFHAALAAGEVDVASELMHRPLLDGLITREDAFDDWLRGARDELRVSLCSAIDSHVDRELAAGKTARAEDLLKRRLTLDPCCEAAHRAMMKIFWQSDRRVEAIRQYENCSGILRTELGVSVSAETNALLASIRAGEPSDVLASVTEPPPAATGNTASEPPSVAVMAFEGLSEETERYFAEGVSEDIITGLSCFGSLRVIARQSAFRFRDSELSVGEMGKQLGASYVVQGSVRKIGERVRINVQLVDADTERHVWAQRFDHELEDVFLAQDEVVSKVVSTLAGRVEAARTAEARRMPSDRLDAYDRVLRGKFHHHLKTVEDCELAIRNFEEAIESDAEYALGHAWLACGLGQALGFRLADREELLKRAFAAAERGRCLDDSESECYRILGQVSLLQSALPQAVHYSERAVELNPNDDRCLAGLGEVLSFVGRSSEGVTWLRRSIRLNPFHPQRYWSHLGRALFHEGQYDDAVSTLSKIAAPRIRDRAYAVAAAARANDKSALERARSSLRELTPAFRPDRFVGGLPYDHAPSRKELLDALMAAEV